MLRTPLCDLLGIDVPIVQASLGPWTSVELVAAVSNAGALGSIGSALWSAEKLKSEILRTRALTDCPFAVNHTLRPLNEEAFAATIAAQPRAISLALGYSADLIKRTHDAGVLFMQQVHTVEQARQAVEGGVDVIIAQGTEAGGFGGAVSTLALVPQVVDAVAPTPVIAAGGIADGRGLAAALTLGAQGINIGTRFIASVEATISEDWKRRIVAASSEDAVKVLFADAIFPPPSAGGYTGPSPRVLRTAFVDEWNARLDDVPAEAERLRTELLSALREERGHELVPFTGQTTGLIHEILPVHTIISRMVSEAERALQLAAGHASR